MVNKAIINGKPTQRVEAHARRFLHPSELIRVKNRPAMSESDKVNTLSFLIMQVPLEVIQQLSSNTKIFNFILKNYPSLLHCKSMSDNGKLNQIPEEEEPRMKRVPLTMSMKVKAMKKKASIANTPVTINENHRLETAGKLQMGVSLKGNCRT